ncbi:MAG: PKD domain-containing protein, partial [Bacteroidetes bacterium]|nr:PKD domain-containing protein [Bacteroidota bacterium]
MKNLLYALIAVFFSLTGLNLNAQDSGHQQGPTLITQSEKMIEVPSIASQIASGTFIPDEKKVKEFNPKHWGSNTSVPGKGFPKGNDPLMQLQMDAIKTSGKAPILSFDAASATATPTDPTGAVGPNHFVNSWNTSFRIWDKTGNALIPAASLGTLFSSTDGDPIVIYDPFADRFLITEFFSNGFKVAISKGPDPVTSGWYIYSFPTNTFPDYPKFTVWSDGYYITANKDQSTPTTSQVVFALERDKMIAGNTAALMIGFPLPGIVTSGFYSPLGFNANGPTMPPVGNAPIVYMQDDAWTGVTVDHLKIWSVNVNWTTPASSTISTPQIINTQPFDGLFDGGSFSNLPQPSGSDIDALQATIMFMAQYRRFSSYNSAVLNFVVDLDGNDNKAGIRWYELRQTADGAPWTIYQEGTYVQPNGHSAFSGNMCMDIYGNIGLAYTVVSTTQNPSLRFTGRYASDPLGTMTIAEDVIINGTSVDPSSRYGDYSQMTVDPVDGRTFWSIGEYFSSGRKNRVGVFQIAPPTLTAMFTGTPTTVCTGGTVTFTDQSLASPTSWTWSFPGGTPSTFIGQTPPAIVYNTAGTYDVTLTVSDGTNNDSEVKTGYITVKNIIANFTGAPTTVVIGNTVTFTDNSSCSPTSWSWSFPGGTPSTFSGQTPPAITYSTLGTYDVSLTVTKPGGTDTKTRVGYITVAPPIFNMTNGTVTTCTGDFFDSGGPTGNYLNNENLTETFYPSTAGSLIRFTFTSFNTESGYDYLRIYNGINTSAPLIGTYNGTTSPGVVTASNSAGALTFNFTSDVSGTPSGWEASISCYSITVPPVADFSASTVYALVDQTVTFTDLSTNMPTSWAWSFSPATVTYVGGTSATSQNPQVQFNALGQYTATLIATNAYGSDTETKTNYITVTNCTFSTLPFTEGFESQNTTPLCWSEENSAPAWQYIAGNGSTHPATAHTGVRNACLKDASSADNKNKLITPIFDLSQYTNISLTFWHTQEAWSTDQDQLTVYYRTSAGGTWVSLQAYTTSVVAWTQRTITLPNTGSYYQIAFEGNARYGYGVCLDDISITGTSLGPFVTVTPSNQNVTTPAGTTTFTVTSNAVWTAVSNQTWCTVTPTGTGNGTITATYAQNTNPAGRIASITVAAAGVSPVIVTVTQAGTAVPTLGVTPPNQNVTAPAGTTQFTVASNSAWSVLSDQTWCTVPATGSLNGTITATYAANPLTTTRVANITVSVIGLTPVVVTVTQAGVAPVLAV